MATGIPVNTDFASPHEMKNAADQIFQLMQSDLGGITQPIPLPAFSTIIKDSDGNLLYFEYPKKENANKFNVWICEKNGRASGVPLRLVKFKVSN